MTAKFQRRLLTRSSANAKSGAREFHHRPSENAAVSRAQPGKSVIRGKPSPPFKAPARGPQTRGADGSRCWNGKPAQNRVAASRRPGKENGEGIVSAHIAAITLLVAVGTFGCGAKAPPKMSRPAPPPAPAAERLKRPTSFPRSPVLQRLADMGAWIYKTHDMEGNRGASIEFREQGLDREVLALVAQVWRPVFLRIDTGCKVPPGALKPLDGMKGLYAFGFAASAVDNEELAAIRSLPDLRTLATEGEGATARGLAFLRNTPRLTRLLLFGRGITDDVLQLIESDDQIVVLQLARTSVTDDGLKALSHLRHLRELELGETSITDTGLANLAPLQSLESLGLHDTDVTDRGLRHLASLRHLRFLGLRGTQISDAGLRSLASLNELISITAGRTKVTARSNTILPNVEIRQ